MKPTTSKREDSRETPKKEKAKVPPYYQLSSGEQSVPCFLYIGPSLEDYEAAMINHKELKFKKIRVKGCQVTAPVGKLPI